MKKTLQEEKERFHQIVEQGATNMAYGFKPNELDELDFGPKGMYRDEKGTAQWPGKPVEEKVLIEKLQTAIDMNEWSLVAEVLEDLKNRSKPVMRPGSNDDTSDEDIDGHPTNPHETDEYHEKYTQNMTQGFAINEGNAFVGAAKKAREEGKDSFVFDGKTYKVTVSKSKK